MIISDYDTFLIDLDDTLYDEKIYLFEAYERIGIFLSKKYNIESALINCFLKETFIKEGRSNLFDKLFNNYKIKHDLRNELLEIMRNLSLKNKIHLFPEAYVLLEHLKENSKKIILVTNGNVKQQENKVNNINWRGLRNYFDVIYAKNFGSKPNSSVFNLAIEKFDLLNQRVLMIGDSKVDSEFAKNCSIEFIHRDTAFEWVK